MGQYETFNSYVVKETADGLDVFVNGQFKCELRGKCLEDYSYENDYEEFEIDDEKLEKDIELELEY